MKDASTSTIRPEDLDFAHNARAALAGDSVKGANLLLFLIGAVMLTFVVWASQARLDEVTRGTGKVIPSASVQTVQNLEGGIIAEILISEGDRVEKGQVLVRIDDTMSRSSYRENLTEVEALRANIVRLRAEAEGEPELTFPEEINRERPDLAERETALFLKRQSELNEQLSTLQQSYRLAADELEMMRPLVKREIISKVDLLRLEREVNELEGKMKEIRGAFQSKAMEEFNQMRARMEGLSEVLEGRQDRVQRTVVRSPVEGTVNHLHVKTLGGVIQPGEPIVDIVPDDETLLVQARIRPQDIAFLSPGQLATVKLTAYDFSMYGGLEGEVEHISADTIEDPIDKQHYYQIKVRNDSGKLMKDGEVLPIIPGMVADVDVLTGRRTVLQYMLKPFHRMRFNAMRER